MPADTTSHSEQYIPNVETIVDADSHIVGEPLSEIVPLIPEQHAGAKKIIEHAGNIPAEIFSTVRAGVSHPFESYAEHGVFASSTSAEIVEEKRSQMEEFGIDMSILNPTLFSAITSINNPRYAVALATAYNEWMLDHIVDREPTLKSNLLIAPQKPHLAAEEIEKRSDEDGIVGIQMPATGIVPPPGHERYDPIYEAAETYELPISMHTNGAMTHQVFPVMYKWNQLWAEDHALLHPFQLMWNLTTMVLRGIPARYPELEFVFSEAGIGWIPYMMWRLDDHYLEHSHESPLLQKLPSEYIRDQFKFTTQPIGHTTENYSHIQGIIEMIDADCILFSSDLPHPDFDAPREIYNMIKGLDDRAITSIMGESASEFYTI